MKTRLRFKFGLALTLTLAVSTTAKADRYAPLLELLSKVRTGALVQNRKFKPNWIGRDFWYVEEAANGSVLWMVDTGSG
ncbi:MAG TPA: hypothetical protein VFV50_03725, partial [Bdellovibrionales bacterium]|nr:hypothetical protein [Bdellovibrionales bacterium]